MIAVAIGFPVLLTQIVNSLIIGVIIFMPFLIGKDARQNGLPWVDTVAWACIATFLFPLGIALYFWLGRNSRVRGRE